MASLLLEECVMKSILGLSIIAVVLLLGAVSIGVGQGSPRPRWVSDILVDHSCYVDGTICRSQGSGCESRTFTVDATGNYSLSTWINCVPPDPSGCGGCYACAHVITALDGVSISGPLHTGCPPCSTSSASFELQAGRQYKLFVCKKPCSSPQNCSTCAQNCAAYAQVFGQ